MKKVVRFLWVRLMLIFRLLCHFKKLTGETYFPEYHRKPNVVIFGDWMKYIVSFGTYPFFYTAYGLDCKERKAKDYMPYPTFMLYRDRFNTYHGDYRSSLQNKVLFEKKAKDNDLIVASSLGIYDKKNERFLIEGNRCTLSELCTRHPHLFIKPVDSIQGKNTFSIDYDGNTYFLNDVQSSPESIIGYLSFIDDTLMVQVRLKNHQNLNKLYCHSLNTLRVITVWRNGESHIIGSLLRLGAYGSIVDNWAHGGMAVGVGKNGTLCQYGFFKPGHGTKTDRHPDTGVVLSSFTIPYYEESLALVNKAQTVFFKTPTIGWDVAITDDGPVIIEGNDNYDGALLQCCCGGMRQKFIDNYTIK